MTKDEAIKCLNEFIVLKKISNITEEEAIECFKLAVEALEQEPCEDAISRSYALNVINLMKANIEAGGYEAYSQLFDRFDNVPSATPKRKVGEWIKKNNDYFDWYECSECGYGSDGEMRYSREYDVRTNYCPKCGTQMLEVENEIN